MSAYQGINLENNFDIEIALQNFKIFDEEYLKTIFETFQDYIYVKESDKNHGFHFWYPNNKRHSVEFPIIYSINSDQKNDPVRRVFYMRDNAVILCLSENDLYCISYLIDNNEVIYNIMLIYYNSLYIVELSNKKSTVSFHKLIDIDLEELRDWFNQLGPVMDGNLLKEILNGSKSITVVGNIEQQINIEELVRNLLKKYKDNPQEIINNFDGKYTNYTQYSVNWNDFPPFSKEDSNWRKSAKYDNQYPCVEYEKNKRCYCYRCIPDKEEPKELWLLSPYYYDEIFYGSCISYVTISENSNSLVYYYFDLHATYALERFIGTHLDDHFYLPLKEMLETGIIPSVVSYIETDDPQEEMKRIAKDPSIITNQRGYKLSLKKSDTQKHMK
jgi:hypothetical protein